MSDLVIAGIVAAVAMSTGCGRIGYDPFADNDGGASLIDASPLAIDASALVIDAGPATVSTFSENGTGDFAGVVTDTTLISSFPDQNVGNNVSFETEFGDSFSSVGLLHFDVSAIPTGAIVDAAELEVYTNFSPSNGGDVVLYRVLEAWSESQATWNDRVAGVPWAGAGASGVSRESSPIKVLTIINSFEAEPHLIQLPVELVQSWVSAPATNLGIAFVAANGFGGFLSSESVLIENSPLLKIDYR